MRGSTVAKNGRLIWTDHTSCLLFVIQMCTSSCRRHDTVTSSPSGVTAQIGREKMRQL